MNMSTDISATVQATELFISPPPHLLLDGPINSNFCQGLTETSYIAKTYVHIARFD